MEILRLAAQGLRTREIADRLGLSTRTVEAEFTTIFTGLGVSTRSEAVAHAIDRGWFAVRQAPSLDLP